MLSLSTV